MAVLSALIREFKYENSNNIILKDIDLAIEKGELIVITGLSGCGKSTLIRLLNGLIPHHYEGNLDGVIKLFDKNIETYEKGECAKYIGNVFQNPIDQFFANTADEEVAFVGENLGMKEEVLREKTYQAFAKMDIEYLMHRRLSELSGGEKQKVAIASTLVFDTDIIFFDEPSSSLDFKGINDFVNILENLKNLGKTIIIAEHRLFFLSKIYDRLLLMDNGKINKIFARGTLTEDDIKTYEMRSLNYNGLIAQNKLISKNEKIFTQGLQIKIAGNVIVEDLSFSLAQDEIMAVLGKNGIGKSSILKAIAGITKSKGKFSFARNNAKKLKHCYYMMQDVDYQLFFDTVENELVSTKKINDSNYLDEIRNFLKKMDLWNIRLEHPQNLSTGQKQRVAIGNAFLSNKSIILLDEPTSGLDYKRMNNFKEIILYYAKERPVIIATHDLELLFKVCNTALLIDEKGFEKVKVDGSEQKILEFCEVS